MKRMLTKNEVDSIFNAAIKNNNIITSPEVMSYTAPFDFNDQSLVGKQMPLLLSGAIYNGPSTPSLNGGTGYLITTNKVRISDLNNAELYVQHYTDYNGITFQRIWFAGSFQAWRSCGSITINVGTDQDFPTLRKGMEAANQYASAGVKVTVVVHPGTYDLMEEFKAEIAAGLSSQTGCYLTNNIHVKCLQGAIIKAIYETTNNYDSVYQYFSPFYADTGNFVLEGATIIAKDTRYCVHDEAYGSTADGYNHTYINCNMYYTNTMTNGFYSQCIGGGLGRDGYISIQGGTYKTDTVEGVNVGNNPISYHNGNVAGAKSIIYIDHVNLADGGYFRFGKYGPSTEITNIYVSNCRMGAAIDLMYEVPSAFQVDNMAVTDWNNVIVTQ